MSSRSRLLILFICGILLYVLNNFQRVCLPGTIFNTLQSDLHADATAIAALGSSFLVVYAFTQLIAGLLVDRYGGTRVLVGGALLFTLASTVFPLTGSLPIMCLCRALIALGGGMFYLAIIDHIRELFPERYPSVLGLAIFIGFLGGALGGLPFAAVTGQFGWRPPLLAAAGLSALLTVVCALAAHDAPCQHGASAHLSLAPYRQALSRPANLIVFLSWCPLFGVYYAMPTVVGAKFLQDFAGLSAAVASSCSTVMLIVGACMNVITGCLIQRHPNREKQFLTFTGAVMTTGLALALAGVLTGASGGLLYAAFVVMAFASGFSPVTNTYVQHLNPKAITGTTLGLMNACTYALVSLFGKAAGLALDAFRDQATVTPDAIIYPPAAYISLLAAFTAAALASALLAAFAAHNTAKTP